jgi:hypothetical protein
MKDIALPEQDCGQVSWRSLHVKATLCDRPRLEVRSYLKFYDLVFWGDHKGSLLHGY